MDITTPPIEYSFMQPGEEPEAIEIVAHVFNEFVAPGYSNEGVAEFFKYACPDALAERCRTGHIVVLARHNNRPVGILELREYRHICFLFVYKEYQGKGVGKTLVRQAVDLCLAKHPHLQKLTVNASPNSLNAYKKMGFSPDAPEQCSNGIRFTPMSKPLQAY